MFNSIFSWIKSLFTNEKIGILFQKLFKNASQQFAKEIFNEENQKKAYEFVKELHQNKDLPNSEKAKVFNKKMAEWAFECGKILASSVINCLREMAVNVLKDELLLANKGK